jgi:transcriptional regulator with XRE-family HTH domain
MVDEQVLLKESVTEAVARNVRDARTERGWTLEQLATRSGVSKGMVVQIEQGRTNPSIGTLSKVSDALGVSLPALVDSGHGPRVQVVDGDEAANLWSTEAGSSARLLVGGRRPDFIELWEWVLAPGDVYEGRAHPAGIRELLHVLEGTLTLRVGDDDVVVGEGASASYDADQPHSYANESSGRVRIVLVMVDPTGRVRSERI